MPIRIPAAALAAALLLAGVHARAADADPPAAKVGDVTIPASEVTDAVGAMAPGMTAEQSPEVRRMALERLIERHLLDQEARNEKLDQTPEYKKQLAELEGRLLRQMLLQKYLHGKMTEDTLKKAYEAEYPGGKGKREIHAHHILVKTKAEAEAVIADLKKGTKFEALAIEKSIDPGARNGGDLGFFGRGSMVKPFEDAAFAMKPGEVSKAPVQTEYGWHVIRVDEERVVPAPDFETARDELQNQVASKLISALLTDLRKKIPVVEYGPDGKPVPPAKP